jgi:hypothetical protein
MHFEGASFVDSSLAPLTLGSGGAPTISSAQAKFGTSSGSFNGTSWVTMPVSSTPLAFGAGDFTIEAWVYPTASTTNGVIYCGQCNQDGVAANNSVYFAISSSGAANSGMAVGATGYNVNCANPALNQWSHVALVRYGSTLTTYLNGVVVQSIAVTGTMNVGNTTFVPSIGSASNGGAPFTGYIDEFRISKGLARYTAAFTPPISAFLSSVGVSDQYYSSVTSLLAMNGVNGSTTITDTGPTPLTWTNVSNLVTLNTATFKYGTASAFFSGASTGITGDGSAAFAFGTGDWTVEMWVKPSATGMQGLYVDQISSGADTTRKAIYLNATNNVLFVTGATNQITGTTVVPTTSFTHIAVCRAAGVTRLFVNGAQEGISWTDATNYTVGAARPVIGNDSPITTAWAFIGYMDDVRISKGFGRYSSNFTPVQCGVGAGGTLYRDVIRASSNGGAAVSFTGNSKDIFLTANAELLDNANIGMQVAMSRGQAMP